MIVRIPHHELEKKVRFFIRHKIPFKKFSTSERTTIVTENWGSWMNRESSFKTSELHFIKQVKEHIVKNQTYRKIRNNFLKEGSTKKIKYFFYNKNQRPGDYFEDIYEIDLKNAYWQTAFALGLFDQPIYEKGLTVTKKTRLAAIGSLAKVVHRIDFDGSKEHILDPERSEKTEFLWHTICSRIGKVMAKGSKIAKKDFLFFWVDAIFVKGESAKALQKFFKEQGYETGMFKCEWIKFSDKQILVKSKEKGKWIKKNKEEIVMKDGKKMLRRYKVKEWRDERPFPYSSSLSESEIAKLSME